MKKYVWVVFLLAVAIVGCTAVEAAPQAEAQQVAAGSDTTLTRYITVVGNGSVSLSPDIARVNIGAEANAATVAEAKAEVDRQIAAILDTLSTLGVEAKDIQTSSYNIHFEREPYPPVLREEGMPGDAGGYRVSSTLNVTVRNVDNIASVLDAVVEAGANQVYGVYFTVDDDTQWQSDARIAAVADAKSRAQELAGLGRCGAGTGALCQRGHRWWSFTYARDGRACGRDGRRAESLLGSLSSTPRFR
jgi:uncharacterized protein YggE